MQLKKQKDHKGGLEKSVELRNGSGESRSDSNALALVHLSAAPVSLEIVNKTQRTVWIVLVVTLVLVLVLAVAIDIQIRPSHVTPYVALRRERAAAAPPETNVLQRLILFGDAGYSTLEPWQASLAGIAQRASISPEKTVVVALGDNIYPDGFPQVPEGQWTAGQRASVMALDAQLRIARVSGARMILVPGNHDWRAGGMEGQAVHIERTASETGAQVSLRPYRAGQPPYPESLDLPGVSVVFVDSEWMLRNDDATTEPAYEQFYGLLARIRAAHPGHLIVVVQHHPMETVGPHGRYQSGIRAWLRGTFRDWISGESADVDQPAYEKHIGRMRGILRKYQRVIHAGGHEHNLQLFHPVAGVGATYHLVSGAGNTKRLTGVWHNGNTRFALSQEGFVEMVVTRDGVYASFHDIHHVEAVAGFWLDL